MNSNNAILITVIGVAVAVVTTVVAVTLVAVLDPFNFNDKPIPAVGYEIVNTYSIN